MSETGSHVDEAVVRTLISKNAGEALPDAVLAAQELNEAYAARLLDITDPSKETKPSPTLELKVKKAIRLKESSGYWDEPGREAEADSTLQRFFDGELHLGNMIDRQDQTERQLNDITTFIRAVKMLASVFTGHADGAEEEGGAIEAAGDVVDSTSVEPEVTNTPTPPVASVFDGDKSDEGEQTAPEATITINLLDEQSKPTKPTSDQELLNQITVTPIVEPELEELPELPSAEANEGFEEEPIVTEALVDGQEDFDVADEAGAGDDLADDEVEESNDAAESGGDDGGEPPAETPTAPEPLEPSDKEKITALLNQIVTRDLSTHYYPGNIDGADDYEQSTAYLAFRDEVKQAWQAQADELGLDPDGWDTVSAKALNYWKQISHNPKSGKPGDSEYFEEGLSHLWITIDENLGDNISAEDRNALAKTSIEVMAAQINDNRVYAIRDYKDGTNYFFEGDDIDIDTIESGVGQIRAERADQEAQAAAVKAKEQADREKSLNSLIEKYAKKGEVPDEVFKKTLTTLLDQTLVDLPSEYAKFESHAKSEAYLERHAEITAALGELATENGWTDKSDYELVATNILKTWFDAGLAKNEGRRIHPDQMTDSLVNLYESIQTQIPVNEPDLLARATVGRLVEKLNREKDARKMTGKIDFEDIESAIVQSRIDVQLAEEESQKRADRIKQQLEIENNAELIKVLGPKKLAAIREKIANNTLRQIDSKESLNDLIQAEFGSLIQNFRVGNDLETHLYWLEIVNRAYNSVEYPQSFHDLKEGLHLTIETLVREHGQESAKAYARTLLKQVKRAYFLGEFTPELQSMVPMGVTLNQYAEEVEALANGLGVRISGIEKEDRNGADSRTNELLQILRAEEGLIAEESRMFGPMMGERGLESYLFMDQLSEIVEYLRNNPEVRMVWGARVFGTLLRGGQNPGMAQFYGRAAAGDEGAPSLESALKAGLEWAAKAGQLEGYLKRDRLHEGFGFFKPEALSELIMAKIPIEAWVVDPGETELRRRSFTLSSQDVLSEYYDAEALRELKANKGEGVGGNAYAQGKLFRSAILRKMGYSYEQIDLWNQAQLKHDIEVEVLRKSGRNVEANKLSEEWISPFPVVKRTNLISHSTHLEVDSLDLIMGENWWMQMMAYSWINFSRADYMLLPIDEVKRRELLGLRDSDPDYYRGYATVEPPFQLISENAVLPDYLSISVMPALVEPLKEMVCANPESPSPIETRRQKMIESLATIEQVSPASSKTLGEMALAVGRFTPSGDTIQEKILDFETKVDQRMKGVSRIRIKRLRPFRLWNLTEDHDTASEVWGEFDFTPLLMRAGYHEDYVASLRDQGKTSGVLGWNTFKSHANASLYDLRKLVWKDVDSSMRYLEPIHAARMKANMAYDVDITTPDSEREESPYLIPDYEGIAEIKDLRLDPKGRDRTVDNASDVKTVTVEQYNKFLESIAEPLSEVNFAGFTTNAATKALNEAAFILGAETNLAFRSGPDSPLFVLDLEVDKVGAGEHFSVKRITREGHVKALMQAFEISQKQAHEFETEWYPKIMDRLSKHMFHFVRSAEQKDNQAVLIGPNSGFVPAVIKPHLLIESLLAETASKYNELTGGQDIRNTHNAALTSQAEDLRLFYKRLLQMHATGFFSWNRLTDGAANITALELRRAYLPAAASGGRIPPPAQHRLAMTYKTLEEAGLISDEIFYGDWALRMFKPNILKRIWNGMKELYADENEVDARRIEVR